MNVKTYGANNLRNNMMDTHNIANRKRIHLTILLVPLFICVSCDSWIGPATENAWQKSFQEALVEGYTDFNACYLDSDAGVYIFEYRIPSQLSAKQVFAILCSKNSNYGIVFKSKSELVLRHSGTVFGAPAFNEYRFYIDERRQNVTVMFANIDSEVEHGNYRGYLKKFYTFCAQKPK